MELLRSSNYVQMENPTPKERYRLDLVTEEKNARELFGFLAVLPAGDKVPYHYHEKRESLIMIIDGEAIETVEGEESSVKAGDVLYIPAGEKHMLENRSEKEVRYFEFYTPKKHDFIEVA